ncbi:MAG: hypothetical protein U5L01_18115 [Rheinheimera sp.]|nr:hypothetical protein [Rheinheimera sp.]
MTNGIEKEESSYRLLVLLASSFAAVLFIVIASVTTEPAPSGNTEILIADMLFDRSQRLYPFTIQNIMWLFFFICAGELWVRWTRATQEISQLDRQQ